MIDDPDFMFLFRLAWTLKKSVQEVLALPDWERIGWRMIFDVFGPLDWRRDDVLNAKIVQTQYEGGKPLRDFLAFGDPSYKRKEQTEEDVFKMFSCSSD